MLTIESVIPRDFENNVAPPFFAFVPRFFGCLVGVHFWPYPKHVKGLSAQVLMAICMQWFAFKITSMAEVAFWRDSF